jgi:CRP/FNR family transcriptional regulator, anaerobic regulatory protein
MHGESQPSLILRQLERSGPFSELSEQGKAILVQGLTMQRIPRGTAILHKGQAIAGAYLVLSGRLRVFTISSSGSEATLYFVEPGEACMLSLNSLFNDVLYPAWVQSETPSSVVQIAGPVYRKLFESERYVQMLTIKALSSSIYRLIEELEQVHSSDHRRRLVNFLLNHADADGILRTTQQQLARHLGTTREVVARLVSALAKGKLVKTQRGAIRIADLFGLRQIASSR